MSKLTVSTNVGQVGQWLSQRVIKQVKFAQMVAVNRTAKLVREGETEVLKRRLDRPTPFTLRSVQTEMARKGANRAEARVFLRDQGQGSQTAPATVLGPNVLSGPRGHKRFEKALIGKGLMKPTQYAVPGPGAQLDAYGNMSRGHISKIMAALGIAKPGGKRKGKGRGATGYFAGDPGGEGAGIWQRVKFASGEGVRPVILFADRAPRYRKRVPFEQVAHNIAQRELPKQFTKAFAEAMRTARP